MLSAQIDEGEKDDRDGRDRPYALGDARKNPSDENYPHPHRSASGKFAVVHNGIIENYAVIKKSSCRMRGVEFLSETDTEVVAQLLDKYYTGDFFRRRAFGGGATGGIVCAGVSARISRRK